MICMELVITDQSNELTALINGTIDLLIEYEEIRNNLPNKQNGITPKRKNFSKFVKRWSDS